MIILKPKNEEIIREALEYLIHKTGCSCEIADDQRIVPCENHEALAALDKLVAETRRETLEELKNYKPHLAANSRGVVRLACPTGCCAKWQKELDRLLTAKTEGGDGK